MTRFWLKNPDHQNTIAWHGLISLRKMLVMSPDHLRLASLISYFASSLLCPCAQNFWGRRVRLPRSSYHDFYASMYYDPVVMNDSKQEYLCGKIHIDKIPNKNALYSLLHHRLKSRCCFQHFKFIKLPSFQLQVYTGVATTPVLFQCSFKLPRFYHELHYATPSTPSNNFSLSSFTSGCRFPWSSYKWVSLPWSSYKWASVPLIQLQVGVPSLIELQVDVASPDRATRQCVTLTYTTNDFFAVHCPTLRLYLSSTVRASTPISHGGVWLFIFCLFILMILFISRFTFCIVQRALSIHLLIYTFICALLSDLTAQILPVVHMILYITFSHLYWSTMLLSYPISHWGERSSVW